MFQRKVKESRQASDQTRGMQSSRGKLVSQKQIVHAITNPTIETMTPDVVMYLQRTIGNAETQKLLLRNKSHTKNIQREGSGDEDNAQQALIVDDSAEQLSSGQMRKNEFLDSLYEQIYEVGTEEYEGTNLTVDGCPYIKYWFTRYRDETSTHVERAIIKYAGTPSSVSHAEQLIAMVAERARMGFRTQVQTGSITELPADVPEEVGQDIVPDKENIARSEALENTEQIDRQIDITNTSFAEIQRGCLKGNAAAGGAGAAGPPAPRRNPFITVGQGIYKVLQSGDQIMVGQLTTCAMVFAFDDQDQVGCYHWPGFVDGHLETFKKSIAGLGSISKLIIVHNNFSGNKALAEGKKRANQAKTACGATTLEYYYMPVLSSAPVFKIDDDDITILNERRIAVDKHDGKFAV